MALHLCSSFFKNTSSLIQTRGKLKGDISILVPGEKRVWEVRFKLTSHSKLWERKALSWKLGCQKTKLKKAFRDYWKQLREGGRSKQALKFDKRYLHTIGIGQTFQIKRTGSNSKLGKEINFTSQEVWVFWDIKFWKRNRAIMEKLQEKNMSMLKMQTPFWKLQYGEDWTAMKQGPWLYRLYQRTVERQESSTYKTSLIRLCQRSEDLKLVRLQAIIQNISRQGWAYTRYYIQISSQQEIKYTGEFFHQPFLGQEYQIPTVEGNAHIYFHICLCSNSWGWLHVKGWCCNPQR